ncbi:MAG: AhpC/TSA family protein [Tannerellaceae bacterium]|nr:AhpC/TSA family protein [Tannerellaceae bacterium]
MKKILLLTATVMMTVSCSEKPGYEIKGTVTHPDLEGTYVYLEEYGLGSNGVHAGNRLDSALVQNGSFTFTGVQEEPVLRTIRFDDYIVPPTRVPGGQNMPHASTFILENGKLQITLDEQQSHAKGTPENDAYAALQAQILNLRIQQSDLTGLMNSDDPAIAQQAEDRYETIENDITALVKDYILKNTDKQTGGKLLYDFRYNLSEEERKEIIDRADATFVAVPGVEKVVDHLTVLQKVAIGKEFTDFEMADTKGQLHPLSEYVGNGKVVLVDFWASWCPPCRRDMPLLVEAYRKYKGKGFEIVGISLDSNQAAWEKGIKDLNITWPQLSDLQGWKNAGAAIYGVNSIPHTVLIDKDGKIIDKYIHGADLDAKLATLLD